MKRRLWEHFPILYTCLTLVVVASALRGMPLAGTAISVLGSMCSFFLLSHGRRNELSVSFGFFIVAYSLFCSTLLIVGFQLDQYSELNWSASSLVPVAACTLLIIPIVRFVVIKLESPCNTRGWFKLNGIRSAITLVIICVPQLIIFLVSYPGVYGYDAGFEIMQVESDDGQLTSATSVPYALFLGGLVVLGERLGNIEFGFSLAMLVQSACLCLISWRVVHHLCHITGSKGIYLISTIFFSFFPLVLIMRVSGAQDALFAGFFLLSVLYLFEGGALLRQNEDVPKRMILVFVLSVLMMALLRNNGIYAYAVMLVAGIALCAILRYWKHLAILVAPVILYVLISGPLYSAAGVLPGSQVGISSIKEMLSIPSQQIARVVSANPDCLNQSDEQLLDEFFSPHDFPAYWDTPCIADSQKSQINSDNVSNNPVGFLQLYLSLGIKDPGNYAEAFLLNSLGFWYPGKEYPDDRMYHPYIEYSMLDAKYWNDDYVEINRRSIAPTVSNLLESSLADACYNRIPVIGVLMNCGTWFFLFVFTLLYSALKRNVQSILPSMLMLGYFVTLLLSPVCIFRYVLPFLSCVPVMLAMLYCSRPGAILLQKGATRCSMSSCSWRDAA